jgi:hypothetical protein
MNRLMDAALIHTRQVRKSAFVEMAGMWWPFSILYERLWNG